MKKVILPGTDLEVSRLCLGTDRFGLDPHASDSDILRLFLVNGGNFIDTAHVYSDWVPGESSRSEKQLGRLFKNFDRKQIILSTKGAHYHFENPGINRVRPEEIIRDLDESLACLDTDCIDLYFLHRDNPEIPVDEIMDCLNEQRRLGKIRWLGCSNWTLPRIREAAEYADRTGQQPFAVNQLMWSMAEINRAAIPADYAVMDCETLAYSRDHQMGIMCFSSQAKGYFTKRWLDKEPGPDLRRVYDNERNEQLFRQLSVLKSAEAVTAHCLRFFEEQPVTAVPIVSCSSPEQLMECCSAFKE